MGLCKQLEYRRNMDILQAVKMEGEGVSEKHKDLEKKIADLEKQLQSQQKQIELLKEAILTGKRNEFVS